MIELGDMHVAAEGCLSSCRHETARGALNARDVLPTSGRMRAGVHEQPAIVFKGEWQLREEFAVGGVEARAGPVDGVGGDRIHAGSANSNRSVVIAGERDSAVL